MDFVLLLPVLLPMLLAPACFAAYKKSRSLMEIAVAAGLLANFALAVALLFCGEMDFILGISVQGLGFVLDGFRKLYLLVIAFAFLATSILAKDYMAKSEDVARYSLFLLLTLGAVNGVFLSADLMTAFTFYEIASFTSFVWVIQEETEGAIRAAKTYLAIAVIGGLLAFMGVLLIGSELGTLEIAMLRHAARAHGGSSALYWGGLCLLLGFGAKAGMFPLHIWLPKAHPVAPAPASGLLSGILTKVGIFGVAAVSVNVFYGDANWGSALLLLGVITMVLGAFMGVLSIDLKRTLACSSMSQIGFVLVGIASVCLLGDHNAYASSGTVLHMLNHSLFKVVLFSAAGVVYMNLHKLDLNEIRGFGRGKKALMLPFLMGALGIAGVPLFSGYISKTLLHEALIEIEVLSSSVVSLAEWLFLISGGCTAAYMAKLFVAVFVEKHPTRQTEFDGKKAYISKPVAVMLLAAALPSVVLGVPPIMNFIAQRAGEFMGLHEFHAAHFFSLEALKGSAISLGIGAVVYLLMRKFTVKDGRYVNIIPSRLDLEDSLYRPLLDGLAAVFGGIMRLFGENVVTSRIAKATLVAGAAFAKAMSQSTDLLALAIRRTVLREVPVKDHELEGEHVIEVAGAIADKVTHVGHHTTFFAGLRLRLQQLRRNIGESFSFALMMTCVGVCAVLVILLLFNR